MARPALTLEQITEILDVYFDVEFSFIKTEEAAGLIVTLPRTEQDFIIDLTRRIAATNGELAFQFAKNALTALQACTASMYANHKRIIYISMFQQVFKICCQFF